MGSRKCHALETRQDDLNNMRSSSGVDPSQAAERASGNDSNGSIYSSSGDDIWMDRLATLLVLPVEVGLRRIVGAL